MAKAKSTDQIFNDMVQQEMAGGRGRSAELQAAINRGRALRAPAPAPEYDHPQIADDMRDFRNDTMYNFARDNGMAGNGQGFSSRDYLNAVDMFDKYMKGETNDTSWSDFFDKHGLKPISRSNLEKRYRASWDSDAGKGGGPVPTGEQQAIMQQVAQAQQPQPPAQAVAPQVQTPAQANYAPSGNGSTEYIPNSQEVNYGLDYASDYSPSGLLGTDAATGGNYDPTWNANMAGGGKSIRDQYEADKAMRAANAPQRDASLWDQWSDVWKRTVAEKTQQ